MKPWNKIEKLDELPIDRLIDVAGYRSNGDKMVVLNCKYKMMNVNNPKGGYHDQLCLIAVRGLGGMGVGGNGEKILWWKEVEEVLHPDDID